MHGTEIFFREPACVFVLQQLQFSAYDRTFIAFHGKVKGRVVVFDGVNVIGHVYFCRKLLPDFPLECIFGTFTIFDFSAGKFPPALPFAVTALGGEDLAIT